MGPSSEVAHRLATRRTQWKQQQINATFYDLEKRLDSWRELVRASREIGYTPTRVDVLNSYLAAGLTRATARLVDLGEN